MRYFSICSLLATSMVFGNPEAAVVSAGMASIEKINAADLHITASDRAVIDWKSFSIAQGETTRFFQPSSSSIVLNRVVGDEISSLMGSLHAQGKVFLVNPHGMIVGKDALIETAGFLMTTFDISNKAFLQGGEIVFKGESTGSIVHLGTIRAIEGDVILIARQIEQHGQIQAPKGSVSIAAASEVLLQPQGKTLLAIRPQLSGPLGVTALESTGVIQALRAEIQADGSAYSMGVRHAGVIDALSVVESEGRVLLRSENAAMECSGKVSANEIDISVKGDRPFVHTGTLQASKIIEIEVPKFLSAGKIDAGKGEIEIYATENMIETQSAFLSARKISCEVGQRHFTSGVYRGYEIELFSPDLFFAAADISGEHVTLGTQQSHSIYLSETTSLKAAHLQNTLQLTLGAVQQFEFVDPYAGSGTQFGDKVEALSTGNVVVTKPGDLTNGVNAGATFLFNGGTGALISTLLGPEASGTTNQITITVLSNGNYVLSCPGATFGGLANVGYVTWGHGTTGVSGIVSAVNSLVGSSTGDIVGARVVALDITGNYVVNSYAWNANTGAATFGNGLTGISGVVSVLNSLVGSVPGDSVGEAGVKELPVNGNYIVGSRLWNMNRGALTWASGTAGVIGIVDMTTNSLVGVTPGAGPMGDRVGTTSAVLPNGNYVSAAPLWDGLFTDVGAVTLCNGMTGTFGPVTMANSLYGTTGNDQIGAGNIVPLIGPSAGRFVVRSQLWNNGVPGDKVGAATWVDSTGLTGPVTTANSLHGTTPSDTVCTSVTPLENGNYVVISHIWNNGAGNPRAGAVTWGHGTTGVSGAVDNTTNSFTGLITDDQVGNGGVDALPSGHFVVRSPNWNGGVLGQKLGAVTWADGTMPLIGSPNMATNSIIGSTLNDRIGGSAIVVLTGGNYVFGSPSWDNAGAPNAGAVTYAVDGVTLTGVVSATNSLVGTTTGDAVGIPRALTNGHYVVFSPNWNNGVPGQKVGAVTWADGTTGKVGPVLASESLIGSQMNDQVGGSIGMALSDGNYVVISPDWNNGAAMSAGAVTLCDGTGPTVDVVGVTNSIVGSSSMDQIGISNVEEIGVGHFVIVSPDWDNGALVDAGAVTLGCPATVGPVDASNSIIGLAALTNLDSYTTDTVNGSFVAGFIDEGSGIVRILVNNCNFIPPTPTPTPVSGGTTLSASAIGEALNDLYIVLSEAPQTWSSTFYGGYMGENAYSPNATYKRINIFIPSLVHFEPFTPVKLTIKGVKRKTSFLGTYIEEELYKDIR